VALGGVGVDNLRKQEKLKVTLREMLENSDEAPPSSACYDSPLPP